MATGLKVTLPTSFTDTTLPILRPDLAISSEATPGALVLLDPSHSYLPAGAGVASGLVIPNVAWESAAAMIGSGDATSLAPTLTYDGSYVGGTTGLFERTAKGGIHGIISQVNNTAVSQGARIILPDLVKTYMTTNSGHSYFVSLWDRITRIAASGHASDFLASAGQNNASPATNRLVSIGSGAFVGGSLGTYTSQAFNALGNTYYQAAQPGWIGTVPATPSTTMAGVFWGSTSAAGASSNSAVGNFNKLPSHIFYRMYIEDLTVSGRTFAQVSAFDTQAFNLAFGSGGRYAGDTFTAVTALP